MYIRRCMESEYRISESSFFVGRGCVCVWGGGGDPADC